MVWVAVEGQRNLDGPFLVAHVGNSGYVLCTESGEVVYNGMEVGEDRLVLAE